MSRPKLSAVEKENIRIRWREKQLARIEKALDAAGVPDLVDLHETAPGTGAVARLEWALRFCDRSTWERERERAEKWWATAEALVKEAEQGAGA